MAPKSICDAGPYLLIYLFIFNGTKRRCQIRKRAEGLKQAIDHRFSKSKTQTKSKLQFTGTLQEEYKTRKSPRRRVLAQNGNTSDFLCRCERGHGQLCAQLQPEPKVCASAAVTPGG